MLVKNIYTLSVFFLLIRKEILLCFRFGRTAIIYLCCGYIVTTFAPFIWRSKCEISASEYCLCFTSIGSSSNRTASMLIYFFIKSAAER